MIILPTTYFGPISWYRQLNAADTCFIDAAEPFRKRTFRNRCEIATPNGRQTLTVPIEHHQKASFSTECRDSATLSAPPITALPISEHNKWRHVHWQALETAYGNSPFFDYYADDIRPFFEPHWDYLFDLNLAIIRKMCELLQVETLVLRGDEGVSRHENSNTPLEFAEGSILSPHSSLLAPCPLLSTPQKEYYQTHAHRTGFLPDLSILDLLFNMGNESILYLL